MVEGIFDVTVSTADRMATRGVPRPRPVKRSIAFWMMSRLASRSGEMLTAASVMKQRFRVGRHVHDEDVLIRRAVRKPWPSGRYRAHQLVSMQAAFHQELALALVDQLDRPFSGRIAVGDIDELELAHLQAVFACHGSDLSSRTDESRNDDAELGPPRSRPAAKSRRRDERQ